MLNKGEYKKGNLIVIYDKNKWSKELVKKSERNTTVALIISLVISVVASSFIFLKLPTDILHKIILTIFSFIFILIYLTFQSIDATCLNKPVDFSFIEWLENLDGISIYIKENNILVKYQKNNIEYNEHLNIEWVSDKLYCKKPKFITKYNNENLIAIIDLTKMPLSINISGKDCLNNIHFDKKI